MQTRSHSIMKAALLPMLLGLGAATDFYITSPHLAVSWKAGQPAKITWDIIPGGPDVSSVAVELMDGDDTNAHVLLPIASGLSPQSQSVEWLVPADFPASSTVFVRVRGDSSSQPVYRYSHRFGINGASSSDSSSPPKQQAAVPSPPPAPAQAAASASAAAATSTVPSAATSQASASSVTTSESNKTTWPSETESIPSASATKLRRQSSNDSASLLAESPNVPSVLALAAALALAYLL